MAEIRKGYLIRSPLKALVIAASPNQTKQNGENQKRESHPLALKSMPLSLVMAASPNQTKQNGRNQKGYLIRSPLKALVIAASPNQTKQNSGN